MAASFNGDLQAGTTYYYRVIATSQDGVSYGAEQSFATSSFPAPAGLPVAPALIPFVSIAEINAKEAKEAKASARGTLPAAPLTRAQKLAKALKLCKRKPKSKRAGCQKQARKKYGKKKH